MTEHGGGLRAGTRIGEFEIVRELGAGGFAITYLAEDRSLGRRVAVKEYFPGDWGSRRRHGGSPGPRPVIAVNWVEATAYVEWLSRQTGERYRLPSELEWEYAARAGTRTARYWGPDESGQCQHADGFDADGARASSYVWQRPAPCSDGHPFTTPVGTYPANAFGLDNILGNVREWTEDCCVGSYWEAPRDGSAWTPGECSRRALRGGSHYDSPRPPFGRPPRRTHQLQGRLRRVPRRPDHQLSHESLRWATRTIGSFKKLRRPCLPPHDGVQLQRED